MFVRNRSDFQPVLARGHIDDEAAVACVSIEVIWAIAADDSLQLSRAKRLPTDPPDIRRMLLWKGTSVTAFGHVLGPAEPPFQRAVRLSVGGVAHDLTVFGERRWAVSGKHAQSTQPERYERLPLSWLRAYGGTVRVPPGYLAGSELPTPGGDAAYPYNPSGVGFYLDSASAHGKRLPNIERNDSLLKSPTDQPLPGGLAPCPELPATRLNGHINPDERELSPERVFHHSLLAKHHAPAPLIFGYVEPGTIVGLFGVGRRTLTVTVPPSPVSVAFLQRHNNKPQPGAPAPRTRVRSIHIDADREHVRIVYAHAASYPIASTPGWVEVR